MTDLTRPTEVETETIHVRMVTDEASVNTLLMFLFTELVKGVAQPGGSPNQTPPSIVGTHWK